jgi:hypothetical protein
MTERFNYLIHEQDNGVYGTGGAYGYDDEF